MIDPINPDPNDIFIEDIAHALSMQCRYSGHTNEFYSVAEHSVRTSYIVPPEDALDALGHDMSEYALVDVPSPLKNSLFGEQYRVVEKRLMYVISKKYGFRSEMPESVKIADNIMLATEVRDLLTPMDPTKNDLWGPWLKHTALPEKIVPMSPREARNAFLMRFWTLTRKENYDL